MSEREVGPAPHSLSPSVRVGRGPRAASGPSQLCGPEVRTQAPDTSDHEIGGGGGFLGQGSLAAPERPWRGQRVGGVCLQDEGTSGRSAPGHTAVFQTRGQGSRKDTGDGDI